jgi:N-acetylneuraminic acid mutarotase
MKRTFLFLASLPAISLLLLNCGGSGGGGGGDNNPSLDRWTATSSTNAPGARNAPSAIWTGAEMIIWGGYNGSVLATGGRYNPATDSWTATSTVNAPSARYAHTAVWTGTEMIIWGGNQSAEYFATGGRYQPSTDSWTATSNANAPDARDAHTAVWTGTEMVVWGGYYFDGSGHFFNNGGRYSPGADTWAATSTANAPEAREHHTVVWTGTEMIVWGGEGGANPVYLATGGRYRPSVDSWAATATANAPDARDGHSAVWTNNEMIIWGGYNYNFGGVLITGGRYNPSADSWAATATANAPIEREYHTAVWTGTEMIVWGGLGGPHPIPLASGGRYRPSTDSWTATSTVGAPEARGSHVAVWSGTEMIIWGGNSYADYFATGGRYQP